MVAPAGPIDVDVLEAGIEDWRRAGFAIEMRDDLLARRGYLAGDDERRSAELMDAVRNPAVDAILCARGGYGCHRIISRLDPRAFHRARKPLVGYSDIATLLLWQQRVAGLSGFHGPMLERGGDLAGEDFETLVASLEGALAPPLRGKPGAGGRGEGVLIGGALAVLVASLGTPWEIDCRGAILLVEEIHEPPYRIDRMLAQLDAAGKLRELAGFGLGSLEGCEDRKYEGTDAWAVIEEFVAPLGIPWVTELPMGHGARNQAWPFGLPGTIDGERGEVVILESGVAVR